MDPFLAGIVTGLSVAAPIGPNGALCIRRSLVGGRRAGVATGLGAATAHALLVTMAIAGLGASRTFVGQGELVRSLAGLLLVVMGLRAVRVGVAPCPAPGARPEATGRRAYVSTLVLALANPLTIASLSALLGSMGTSTRGPVPAALVVGGVFTGSVVWWVTLSSAVVALRARVSSRHLVWLHQVSAVGMATFGVFVLSRTL